MDASPPPKLNLLAAVQGGIAQMARMGSASARSTPQHAGPSPAPDVELAARREAAATAALPLHRRLGRRAVRLLRPLALPFLVRFQARVTSGVDGSQTALRSVAALEMQGELLRRLDRVVAALDHRSTSVAEGRLAEADRRVTAQGEALTASLRRVDEIAASLDRLARRVASAERDAGLAAEYGGLLLNSRAIPLGREVLARTPQGWLLLPAEDPALLATMVETGGAMEPGTVVVLQAVAQAGDLVVDAGANVGAMTLALARTVGPAGRVVAVEPTPRLAELIGRTAALNGLSGVISVEECALGAGEGTGRLWAGVTSGHSSLLPLPGSASASEVRIRPLDALLPAGTAPALIKIDVEGFELDVWKGMSRVLSETPDLAAVVEFGPSHLRRAGIGTAEWLTAFTGAGFTVWEIEEATGVLHPLRTTGLDEVFSINLLMLRHAPERWPSLRVVG